MRRRSLIALAALSLLIHAQPFVFAADPVAPTGSTTAPATTTAPAPTTPSTDTSTPDFLKEYATPPTTAVGPIVPVVPKVTPAPVAAPVTAGQAIKEAPKSPAKPAAVPMLKGRLEEVAGSGASLPVGLLLNLKAQKGKLDASIVVKPQADKLKGLVASFPTDWQGSWGGPLLVWGTQFDPAYAAWDPVEFKEMQKILYKGASGQTTFNFYQSGPTIQLQPAQLVFAARTNSYNAQQLKASPLANMLGNNPMAGQILSTMATTVPVMYLGDLSGATGVSGNQLNSRVVKNSIKQLKPGLIEQNIVTQESERNAQNGQLRYGFSENVLRFTKLNQNQIYVQVAMLKYRNDGHFLSKVIMYGTVNRGQGQSMDMANPFGGMPGMGSFPGMPTSPAGGLNDLNNLIKNLQGL